MEKILIALIHNNEELRLRKLRPLIKSITIPSKQILFYEPPIQVENRFKFFKVFMVSIRYLFVSISWSFFCKAPTYKPIFREIFNVYKTKKRYLDYKRKVGIVHEISLKHLRSWHHMVKNDFDYLVVFESDTVISDLDQFCAILGQGLEFLRSKKNTLLLLGNGYQLKELNVRLDEVKVQGNFTIIDHGLTNTLFAYAVHRRAAQLILKEISNYPSFIPFIAMDWLINHSFIKLEGKNIVFNTLICNKEIVEHGSRIGKNSSWQ